MGESDENYVYLAQSSLVTIRKPIWWFSGFAIMTMLDGGSPAIDLVLGVMAYCGLLMSLQVLGAGMHRSRACTVLHYAIWLWLIVRMFSALPWSDGYDWLWRFSLPMHLGMFWVFWSLRSVCSRADARSAARAWMRVAWVWGVVFVMLSLLPSRWGRAFETFQSDYQAAGTLVGAVVVISPIILLIVAAAKTYAFAASRSSACPSCRYDLTGLRDDRCPECGTRVNREERGTVSAKDVAIRKGQVVFSSLPAIVLLSITYFFTPGNAMIGYKPMWLLLHESQRTSDSPQVMFSLFPTPAGEISRYWTADAIQAQREIVDRIKNKEFSSESAESIAVIARQTQEMVEIEMRGWQDMMFELAEQDLVPSEILSQYAQHMFRWNMVTRPIVRPGGPVPFEILGSWRGASDGGGGLPSWTQMHQVYNLQVVAAEIDGEPVDYESASNRYSRSGSGVAAFGFERAGMDDRVALPVAPVAPGPHTLTLTLMKTTNIVQIAQWKSVEELEALGIPLEETITLEAEFVVAAGDEWGIEEIDDAEALRMFLEDQSLRVHPGPWRGSYHVGGDRVIRRPRQEGFGADFSMRIFVVTPAGPLPIGGALFGNEYGSYIANLGIPIDEYDELVPEQSGELTFILRSDPSIAERTLSIYSTWVGDDITMTVQVDTRQR